MWRIPGLLTTTRRRIQSNPPLVQALLSFDHETITMIKILRNRYVSSISALHHQALNQQRYQQQLLVHDKNLSNNQQIKQQHDSMKVLMKTLIASQTLINKLPSIDINNNHTTTIPSATQERQSAFHLNTTTNTSASISTNDPWLRYYGDVGKDPTAAGLSSSIYDNGYDDNINDDDDNIFFDDDGHAFNNNNDDNIEQNGMMNELQPQNIIRINDGSQKKNMELEEDAYNEEYHCNNDERMLYQQQQQQQQQQPQTNKINKISSRYNKRVISEKDRNLQDRIHLFQSTLRNSFQNKIIALFSKSQEEEEEKQQQEKYQEEELERDDIIYENNDHDRAGGQKQQKLVNLNLPNTLEPVVQNTINGIVNAKTFRGRKRYTKQLFHFDETNINQFPFQAYNALQYHRFIISQLIISSSSSPPPLMNNDDTTTTVSNNNDNINHDDITINNKFDENDNNNSTIGSFNNFSIHKIDDRNSYLTLYKLLCQSIQFIDPAANSYGEIQSIVRNVIHDIKQLNRTGQQICMPILVSAVVSCRSNNIGALFGQTLYRYVIEQKFDVSDGWYEHLLSHSRYLRQSDLPYADIVEKVVMELHRRPEPGVILAILDNTFPFTNTSDTLKVVKAIYTLQQQSIHKRRQKEAAITTTAERSSLVSSSSDMEAAGLMQHNQEQNASLIKDDIIGIDGKYIDDDYEYIVDIGTIEIIGAAAANKGDIELNMILWDLLDLYNYQPTEAMYENTAMTFAHKQETYLQALTVVLEMEQELNVTPSRALIRSLSRHIRNSSENIAHALEQLDILQDSGRQLTVSLLNIIMSSLAERGDMGHAMSFLRHYFEMRDVEPNVDTYDFAMESVGKFLFRIKKRSSGSHWYDRCLEAADEILSKMDSNGIAPTHHIIRDYTELLCYADQPDTAADVLLDAVQHNPSLVNSKTLYRVASANSSIGRFDTARTVATCIPGLPPLPNLLRNIDRDEKVARKSNMINTRKEIDTGTDKSRKNSSRNPRIT